MTIVKKIRLNILYALFTTRTYLLVTLCAYVQQGYVFGCISLCTYIHTYMYVDKKLAV